jgi:hypothetical protein
MKTPKNLDDILKDVYAQHKEAYHEYLARKRTLNSNLFDEWIVNEEAYLKIIDKYFESHRKETE